MRQEPIAYINVEERKLEFAKPIMWHTPTVVNLERIPLYTHQRTWVGLTDEDIWDVFGGRIGTSNSDVNPIRLLADARKLEAKLKQKNGFSEEKNT